MNSLSGEAALISANRAWKKGTLNQQNACNVPELFLHAQNRVFGRFGNAELYNLLGFDLNRFTGGGISASLSNTTKEGPAGQPR